MTIDEQSCETPPTAPITPMTQRDVSEALLAACRRAGVAHVFGVPGGGANLDVVGAAESNGIEFVLAHTETAAAIMAAVTGELTGVPGVCIATRGPGAASAVNGAAQALLDRQAVLVVTDCVSERDSPRISHQRLDQRALFAAVSKASVLLDGRDAEAPSRAVALATEGRPGPIHIDIDTTASPSPERQPGPRRVVDASPGSAIAMLDELLAGAARPVLVVGVGAAVAVPEDRAAIFESLGRLCAATNVPVLCTYKARGFAPDSASWSAGAATGATIEAPLLREADLIVGIGLDAVEYIPASWPYEAPVALLNSWPVDDSTYFGDRLVCDVVGPLVSLVEHLESRVRSTWPEGTGAAHRRRSDAAIMSVLVGNPAGVNPQHVAIVAADIAPSNTTATVDAGAHMLPVMHLWRAERPASLLISSGLATMGFALPAAIAASLARPGEPVVCFTGDGGLGMVLAELETVSRLDLPVVVVVFNDSTLSLIAAKQRPEGHGGARAVEYRHSDFAMIGRSFGIESHHVTTVEEYRRALSAAFASGRPAVIDVAVDGSQYGALLDAIRGNGAKAVASVPTATSHPTT